MNIILGIDTGGTYTDGVVVEYETKKILRTAKVFTTKENLLIGISNCIDTLGLNSDESVCFVVLSTTLATNAVVEGKHRPVGLITIGATGSKQYPAEIICNLPGKLSIIGHEEVPLLEKDVRQALISMQGKIEALAISGYASVRNQNQELMVKRLAQELLNVPIVCAHELTSHLGFEQRTITAVLNAQLIPIIKELIQNSKQALKERGINAPLALVKGDGHLMLDTYAESRPIDTILSGPAASVTAGKALTNLEDAVVVDMGGTTTDIIIIENGNIALNQNGASVGGWVTHVQAVKVNTVGLGGDSHLHYSSPINPYFGPDRVEPLCVAAIDSPHLLDELKSLHGSRSYLLSKYEPTDCCRILNDKNIHSATLTDVDHTIFNLLKDGPHTLLYLCKETQIDMENLDLSRLMQLDLIQMISITPTDILHATGAYRRWNHEASLLGASILAAQREEDLHVFLDKMEHLFVQLVYFAIVDTVCAQDSALPTSLHKETTHYLLGSSVNQQANHFKCQFSLLKPLVGIGAPSCAWLPKVAELLSTTLILPEYSEVASAIGAAYSNIGETLESCICHDPYIKKYVAFLPYERKMFDSLDAAKDYTRQNLAVYAQQVAKRIGAPENGIQINEMDEFTTSITTRQQSFLQTRITASINGDLE